jgi:hypothetical protein
MGFSTSGEFTNAERTKLTNIEALADVTNNSNAVMDADFSGARGFMKKTSAGVYDLITSQELNADIIDLIKQMHPNISVLAAMDEATYDGITKSGNNYVLGDPYYSQTFDSLNNGDLNTQDDWSGSTNFDVQAVVYQGGSGKAIENGVSSTASIDRSILSREYGTAICYLRQAQAGNDIHFILMESSSERFDVMLHDDGHIKYHNNAGSDVNLPTDITWSVDTWYKIEIKFDCTTNKYVSIKIDDVEKGSNLDATPSSEIDKIRLQRGGGPGNTYHDNISISGESGAVLTYAIAANAAVLSFFSHLKGKFSNGARSHALPIGVEIFGNGDSYAAALNGTTKFKIDVADPRIELYRTDDSVVAKSNTQTDWTLDDNATNGAFAAKTTSTHETILAEEIGCASVVLVEKSVNGAFTDTEILIEDDDYTVDYSTITATKIIITSAEAADIVISQSKLRITWIADVEDIEGTANTALKMKIYLNRTAVTEASPEIQKIDLGTDKYAEMQYLCG